MNTTIVTGNITEEQFRQNDSFRDSLNAFFDTSAGAALMYILRKKGRAKGSSSPVPPEAIEIMSVTELSRLRGIEEVIELMERLCEKIEIPTDRKIPETLGHHDETSPFMPPLFKVKSPQPPNK